MVNQNPHLFSDCRSRWSKELKWENDCGSFLSCFLLVNNNLMLRSMYICGFRIRLVIWVVLGWKLLAPLLTNVVEPNLCVVVKYLVLSTWKWSNKRSNELSYGNNIVAREIYQKHVQYAMLNKSTTLNSPISLSW